MDKTVIEALADVEHQLENESVKQIATPKKLIEERTKFIDLYDKGTYI